MVRTYALMAIRLWFDVFRRASRRGQGEIVGAHSSGYPSVYRRIGSTLNLERPEKYANSSASTCFFLKTPLSWYGRRRPRFWRYIFAPASVAGDMLGGVVAGPAVGALDSPRLGRVRRRPVEPLGSEVL